MADNYNFSSDFQDSILACLIRHPDEFFAFGEIIKPAYFTGAAAAELVFRLQDYRRQYGAMPSFSTLGNFAFAKAARINPDHAKETLEYVQRLAEVDTSNHKAIRDMCIDFARERAIFDAIRKIHAAQIEGKGDKIDPIKLMRDATSVGMDLNDMGLSLKHHVKKIVDSSMARDAGVHTGYMEFDRLWKTGWCPGWLVVLLAPPKRFKTTTAINLALNIANQQNKDVLYYACEISQELAAMRALYNLTGWNADAFFEEPEKGIITARAAIREKLWGTVVFKGFPSKTATIANIQAHAQHVIQQYSLSVGAIVLDYAETIRPDTTGKDSPDWRQQADIYTQARAMGSELGACVIMPDRCNRETIDRPVPSMKSFQGAIEKAGIVDIGIGLCGTEGEIMSNRMRYFVFLNRHGPQYKHYEGTVDPERMRITVGREIEYNPDEEDADSKVPRTGERKRRPARVLSDKERQIIADAAVTQQD